VDLRSSVSDPVALAVLDAAIRGEAPGPDVAGRVAATLASVCPYRGLRPFREEDAPFFFGRDKFTGDLVQAVETHSLVAVVGASGSGKSSVVRAGLVPRLRQAKDRVWDVVTLVPTDRPFHALAAALLPLLEPELTEVDRLVEIGKTAKYLAEGELALRDLVTRLLQKQAGTDRLLLVADQWERAKDRPHPQNQHVWGEMPQLVEGELIDGRSSLFLHLAVECHLRDPNHQKTLICLMDGEEPLWAAKEEWLDRAVEILDFFPVLDHLGKIKRSLPKSCPADDCVDHHARMLLEGKVDYVVRNFGRFINEWKLRGKAKAEMQRGIGYFRRNRERMRYDEYLAKGYPIGSGVAEGTCRNLVKDRMELTGMRWERRGAQSMIPLRALYLNGEWKTFINYRIEKEQKQLHGKSAAYNTITDYAQAL